MVYTRMAGDGDTSYVTFIINITPHYGVHVTSYNYVIALGRHTLATRS
jgi:hypothetical protein